MLTRRTRRSFVSARTLTLCLAALLLAAVAPGLHAQVAAPGFSKSFNPATIGPGSVSTLQFVITNPNGVPVREVAFADTLPAGVVVASPANASTDCPGGLVDATAGGSTITLADAGIGALSTCTVSVDVTSTTPGTHTNVSGDLTSDAGNSGSATADLIVATDRPGFTKAFSPALVGFGDRSRLTLTIDNSANDAAAANLAFTDPLPTGMTVASPANSATTCGGGVITAPAGGSTVSYGPAFFSDATVAAGASCTVEVDVIGGSVGELGNTTGELTSIEGFGQARSSGKAGAVLTVTVDRLALTKSFEGDPVAPGGTVLLTFTLRNLDRESPVTALTFTDDLDAVLTGLVATGTPLADPCGAGSSLTGTSVLTLTGGSLPATGSCTFSVLVAVPAAAPSGSFANVTSTVTGDAGGREVTGQPATDLLFVAPVPVLTKTFVDDPVGAGGSVTLEFTLTNTSATSSASGLAFQDVFPEELPTASVLPGSGFCGAGASATFTPLGNFNPATLSVSGASLGPGESCTFSLVLDVAADAAGGIYPNVTSDVTGTVDGETVTGGPATDDLEIVGAPFLQKEFTDDPVAAGGTVTLEFTLSHAELAPAAATGITFSDDLDAALSGLVATGLPLPDVCGVGSTLSGTMTLLLTGGSLQPGESCTFSVPLQVPAGAPAGPHANTTSSVVASVGGVSVEGPPASDDLRIAGVTLTKEFVDDPVLPGDSVTLRFTITNDTPGSTATGISFQDDLNGVLPNLAATGLPLADPCGAGSSLTGVAANTLLVFQDGTLGPGESCSFDVTLQVPAGTPADTYLNRTRGFVATIEGETVLFDNASDALVVEDTLLDLDKEFVDDPVGPGEPVTLRFTLDNLSSEAVTGIGFTDDLDAALSGLISTTGTLTDVCGLGSSISGTGLLTFTGGSLGAGASCSFDVTLAVPADAPLGATATNTTSVVTGTLGGLAVTGDPATDVLEIDSLAFTKAFGGEVTAGGTVALTFTIENLSGETLAELGFSDDLNATLPGLAAIGLPAADVCGEGSLLSGTTFLTLSGASLLPGGSCSFSVDLAVPAGTPAGSYVNVTSELQQLGLPLAAPATATLVVIEVLDSDGDGVLDPDDVCPGTIIPEGVPTRTLRPNRYALVDGDFVFDTNTPPGGGPGDVFTTTDTAGCSCEQIIDALGLGNGHRFFGCSLSAMRDWADQVNGLLQVTVEPSGPGLEHRRP